MKELQEIERNCLESLSKENRSSVLPSPLEGDEIFSAKILSRDLSPTDVSSRIYFRSIGQVPFDWEVQPGEPKCPPKSNAIPQLSPPPAFQSAQVLQGSPRKKVPTPSRNHRKLSRRQMRSWLFDLGSFSSLVAPSSLHLSKCFGN